MVTVGIVGNNSYDVLEIMNAMFEKSGVNYLCATALNAAQLADAFVEAVKIKASHLILNVGEPPDKVSSLKFDVLVFLINNGADKLGLGNMLKKKSCLILNCEKPLPKEIYAYSYDIFITCGFSRTASVTVSAVNVPFEEKILYCLQRELFNIKGEKIEPAEISVNVDGRRATEAMAAITAAMVSGVSV